MAGNRVSKYSIELEIKGADDTRRSIDDIEKTLSDISKSAKDGIGEGLNNAAKDADELAKKIKEIAKNGEQSTAEIEAYGKAASKAISELEKQSTKLTYSLSDQGKAQRERIADLQKELKTLGQTKEEKQKAREIEKEIRSLQKDVVEGSDQELQDALKKNRSIRATLKLSQQEAKLNQAQAKQNKSMMAYVKDDLKLLKEKLKLQFDFIKSLKTTEGRYKAIKAAAGKIAKVGAIGAGGLAAGALALGGMAAASASQIVDREREADRIKTSMSKDEKQALLGDLYIKTGADYTTIVDAINRVTTILGTNLKSDELSQAAAAEIRFPGAAAMFRQQNSGKATAGDFSIYQNRLKAIQGATGATVEQVQSSTEKIANMRQSSFSNASMTELQALYLALQNSGAYDTQEELDRAFISFVRSQKNSKESVFDHARSFNWQSRAYGATNKQQVTAAMQNLNWNMLESAAKTTDSNISQSESEKTAQKMREFEEKKNQLLMKIVEAIAPVFEAIDTSKLSEFFESLIKFVSTVAPSIGKLVEVLLKLFEPMLPYIAKIVEFVGDTLVKIIDIIQKAYNWIMEKMENSGKSYTGPLMSGAGISSFTQGMARANGGLVSMPSIAGEAGSEMVVPLDFSRAARGRELTQNLTQYFNMSGNETTALSLSNAVRSRDFSRAMASNAFLNGRLGR